MCPLPTDRHVVIGYDCDTGSGVQPSAAGQGAVDARGAGEVALVIAARAADRSRRRRRRSSTKQMMTPSTATEAAMATTRTVTIDRPFAVGAGPDTKSLRQMPPKIGTLPPGQLPSTHAPAASSRSPAHEEHAVAFEPQHVAHDLSHVEQSVPLR